MSRTKIESSSGTSSHLAMARIHIDFAGPFLGKMFLDAHSKWPWCQLPPRPKRLKHFKQYLRDLAYRNSWCLIMDPSSHLKNSSNSYNRVESSTSHQLTDWRNDLYKLLRIVWRPCSENDGKSLNTRIASFLASYRSTPHATTGVAPNELFLRRKVRTKFDMLQPDVQRVVQDKQSLQKKYHDNRAKLRTFTPGQTVMARDYLSSKKWIPGVIETSSGPTMYKVKIYNGKIIVRHN